MKDVELLADDLRSIANALRKRSPVVLGVSDSIRLRLLRRYFDASQRNVLLHVAALAVVLFGIAYSAPWLPRLAVFGVLVALLALRRGLARRQLADLNRKTVRSSTLHDACLLLMLLGWGVAPWLVTDLLAPQADFFALCFVAVVAIGLNSFTYLSALPINALFLSTSMWALAFSLAWHGTAAGWALAAGVAVSGIAGLVRLCSNHRMMLRMMQSEQKNVSLIAQLQRMHDQLELENRVLGASLKDVSEAAVRDPLTDAFNRMYLTSIAQPLRKRVHEHGEAITLCLIDVDHFKRINDRWGHGFGDRVLQGVVEQLKARLRDADRLVRYGGEEFLVILRRCDVQRGRRVAEALRDHVASLPLDGPEGPVFITASVGVARWHADETLDAVLLRADRALYRAKDGGRDRVEVDRFDDDEAQHPTTRSGLPPQAAGL